jgi:tetratricopeptide (TPR) repeat protein
VLAAAVVAVHWNALQAPFIFDDDRIVETFEHHHLPTARAMVGSTRPIVQLSFAANYAIGKLDVWGYHAVNLVIHVLGTLLLFGIVRLTLLREAEGSPLAGRAAWLAFAVALLWSVHPLQTESVTFLSQRAESLAGFFSLATLYCVLRGATSVRSPLWYGAAVLACTLGMGTKPVMVATPVVVALYDRAFLAGSWRAAWRRRRGLYVWLAASWTVLLVVLSQHHESEGSAGFSMPALSAWMYARSQPGVVLHYLRLVVWPWPLVLDYGWPVADDPVAIVLPGLAIGGLVALSVWAYRRSAPLGFLGAAFFVLVAPSASVVPIKDLAAEHRMYLPLAPLVVLLVLGADRALGTTIPAIPVRSLLTRGLLVTTASALALLTVRRNAQYLSPIDMWQDVVTRRPDNARAHNNLAFLLFEVGRGAESAREAARAVELDPTYADAHNNLGRALAELGRDTEAEEHYTTSLRLRPDNPAAHNNFGLTLQKVGRTALAIRQYEDALRIDPDYAEAYNNRGLAFASLHRYEEAVADYDRSLRLKPGSVEVRGNLGSAMLVQGNFREAVRQYAAALELAPNLPELHYNMALALSAEGRQDEARRHYAEAIRLKPALASLPAPGGPTP